MFSELCRETLRKAAVCYSSGRAGSPSPSPPTSPPPSPAKEAKTTANVDLANVRDACHEARDPGTSGRRAPHQQQPTSSGTCVTEFRDFTAGRRSPTATSTDSREYVYAAETLPSLVQRSRTAIPFSSDLDSAPFFLLIRFATSFTIVQSRYIPSIVVSDSRWRCSIGSNAIRFCCKWNRCVESSRSGQKKPEGNRSRKFDRSRGSRFPREANLTSLISGLREREREKSRFNDRIGRFTNGSA